MSDAPAPRPAARGTAARPRRDRLALDPAFVVAYLQQIEREYRARTTLGLVGGIALSLFTPILFTLFFYVAAVTLIAEHGFVVAYLIVAAVTLPAMFAIAYFLKGSLIDRAVEGDVFDNPFMARRVGAIYIVADIANIGPRLTLWAAYRIRHKAGLAGADLGRLAAAIVTLAHAAGGIPPAALLVDDEPGEALEPILAYLLSFDIADLSKRGDRVWLSSFAKGKLGLPA